MGEGCRRKGPGVCSFRKRTEKNRIKERRTQNGHGNNNNDNDDDDCDNNDNDNFDNGKTRCDAR